MDYKYINQLLERYWEGKTTLEEEQILRSFFSQLCVPEELAKFRPLFNYEQTETKTNCLGNDFDERIMSMIDEPQHVEAKRVRISQRFAPLFKAAAMVAIVLTLSQAAQLSFQSGNSTEGVPASYTQHPTSGASVALNDSLRRDSLKNGNIGATVVPQMSQNGPTIIK
ncbi:pyruvate ferredoxin oxidoreductase [Prevotella sp.]|uniref:pyruvate ferredoxin oxidoreductase n=1 Tax=Prevotella sp. TaxID=59823 RepID=UPI0027E376F0|nr:pyruvate ferredoxin oxidoreductase [Prevotella sp.]